MNVLIELSTNVTRIAFDRTSIAVPIVALHLYASTFLLHRLPFPPLMRSPLRLHLTLQALPLHHVKAMPLIVYLLKLLLLVPPLPLLSSCKHICLKLRPSIPHLVSRSSIPMAHYSYRYPDSTIMLSYLSTNRFLFLTILSTFDIRSFTFRQS